MYKFYVRMDGDIFGPYSAKEMLGLGLLDDTMVTESNSDLWQAANKFDFQSLAKEEILERLTAMSSSNATKDEDMAAKKDALKRRLQNNGNLANKINTVKPNAVTKLQFPPEIEFKAKFNEGLNSIAGKIIITPTQLIFHPHSLNFGDLRDRIFEIQQISGYEKGILFFMYISFISGQKIKLTVWHKDEIIKELETRKKAIINS